MVELCSVATSARVCSDLSCIEPGAEASILAASESSREASSSPVAAITLARRSRSASAWRDIARTSSPGSEMSRIWTSCTSTPKPCVDKAICAFSSLLMSSL